jgi:hypothetical protein
VPALAQGGRQLFHHKKNAYEPLRIIDKKIPASQSPGPCAENQSSNANHSLIFGRHQLNDLNIIKHEPISKV